MNAEQQTAEALTASNELVEAVGNRIYPDEVDEEDDALPAITFERSATQDEYALNGDLLTSKVTMTIDVWAETRAAANQIIALVTQAMHAAGYARVELTADRLPELRESTAFSSFEVWEDA